jgi:monoterpene epsilon-lactone hydrolase
MSLELAIDQPARLASFIEMERPAAADLLRRLGKRALNRVVQTYLNDLVRRTEAARGDPAAFAGHIARWRALRERAESASMPHASVEAIRVAAPHHGLPAPPVPSDWFAPVRGQGRGFVFYVHGGSFVFERSPALTELVMRIAASAGARVFAPNYRLAPEHPCPAAVEDTVGAYRWFREHWPDEPVVAMAESAGGSILLAALQTLRRDGDEMPDGVVLLSPWVDLTLQSWSIIAATLAGATGSTMPALALWAHLYLDGRSAGDPLASPLFGDFSGFPPMLVHASRGDLLFDDSARLVERVRDAGADLTARLWIEDAHVFEKSWSAKARQSIDLASDFIARRLA